MLYVQTNVNERDSAFSESTPTPPSSINAGIDNIQPMNFPPNTDQRNLRIHKEKQRRRSVCLVFLVAYYWFCYYICFMIGYM